MSKRSVQWCGLLTFISLIIPLTQARAMTIAPERVEVELAPGDSLIKNIRIFNEGRKSILVSPELRELTPPSYNRAIDVATEPARSLGAELVTFNPDTFQLATGAWVDFPIQIHVPATFASGGYYATLFFQFIEEVEDGSGGVGIVGKIGSILLLSVIGPVDAAAELAGVDIEGRSGGIFDHLPTSVSYQLKNTGDVHVVPHGTLTITNWFQGVRERVQVNVGNLVLLPGWVRTFEEKFAPEEQNGFLREWQGFGFGRYRLELALTVGARTVNHELWFWVIPWRSLGLGALTLLILLTLRSLARTRGPEVP